jgi:hypothetical protein
MSLTSGLRCLMPAVIALLAVPAVAAELPDAEGCRPFIWNVAAERALFAGTGERLDAGRDADTAPLLTPGRLAVLQLPAQGEVSFARPPGKTRLADGAHGGILRISVPADGEYRIALSSTHWVDVVDGGQTLRSGDFHGASGCKSPRKLVRYRLPGGRPLLIQLSGAVDAELRLTVTPEP